MVFLHRDRNPKTVLWAWPYCKRYVTGGALQEFKDLCHFQFTFSAFCLEFKMQHFSFLLVILFIYISNVVSPPQSPYPLLLFSRLYEGAPHPPTPASPPGTPLQWVIEPSQDQGPLLPLVILCYICSWSHRSLHIYSLVAGLVPRSSGVRGLIGWYYCSSVGYKSLQLLQSFL